ncbi:MAG: hypothetical protein PHW74_06725 [Desulfobacca sp.]|nr:hypothetical protein [Desulfobacca sp.]
MAPKEAHRQQVMTRLKEVESEIEKLQAGAKEMEAAAREKFGELTKNLHTSLAVVEEELMELVESEAWDKLKERMNTAIKDLHQAVQNAAAQCR